MKNVTLSMDESLLAAAREYARQQHTSLNALIRHLLAAAIDQNGGTPWTTQFLQAAARAQGNSRGRRWRREDLYDV